MRTFVPRAVLAALAWYALTDGATGWDVWVIGVPAVLIAAALGSALVPPFDWSWRGALEFIVFFVRESWLGGLDVARRAFDPRMPLAPGFFAHSLDMQTSLGRVAVSNSSTLMPGSLVVDIEDDKLLIHALDVEQPSTKTTVAATETAVAKMLRAGRFRPAARGSAQRERG